MPFVNHRQQQVDAIAEALQEMMAGADSPMAAQQVLVDAVNSWYDYYCKELEKWTALKRFVEQNRA